MRDSLRRRNFAELQDDLRVHLSDHGISDLTHGTIVVLPSITFPAEELRKIVGIVRYEERLLCLLLWLRNPALRIVFVTSMPVAPEVLDYYLAFLPDPEDARRRLTMVSLDRSDTTALSQKLVDDPVALERIRSCIEPSDAYLLPFNVTSLELALSESLRIPTYGPAPALAELGSKSGARHLAHKTGVPVLEGSEDLYDLSDVTAALLRLRQRRPGAQAAVIKLNNGFSGQGNAIVGLADEPTSVEDLPTVFCASEESWATFGPKIEQDGAIVEELLHEPGVNSPSVQMRIVPHGEVELVSTHDQILGGPDDQVYLGCRFPALDEYRLAIQEQAMKIGNELAARGVIGTFGMDFLGKGAGSEVFLSEINLRMGGTTHPFLMARLATGGTYDASSGTLLCNGSPRFYVATDNLKSESYVQLKPRDVIDEVVRNGWSFDKGTGTGVLLHLLGAVSEYGKLGMTCVASSREDAESLYEHAVAGIDARAEGAG
ncbi:MAG: peptide ligase PGM1-related protein [Actinomycetota bacterium]|nr:peptide ligase PGM1-related protein [Actinomycetota bacterium]